MIDWVAGINLVQNESYNNFKVNFLNKPQKFKLNLRVHLNHELLPKFPYFFKLYGK